MRAPCKGCENVGCGKHHDHCEKYMEYRKEHLEMYEKNRIDSDAYYCKRTPMNTPRNSTTKAHKRRGDANVRRPVH